MKVEKKEIYTSGKVNARIITISEIERIKLKAFFTELNAEIDVMWIGKMSELSRKGLFAIEELFCGREMESLSPYELIERINKAIEECEPKDAVSNDNNH